MLSDMTRWLVALVVLAGHHAVLAQEPRPAWTINLAEVDDYRRFDQVNPRQWTGQQGIRFITPDEIAVYQISRTNTLPPLKSRDDTGGAGSFFFRIAVLDAQDGHTIKKLSLPTDASLSSVIPAHDGNFIVRTGNVFYLYSSRFEQLASRSISRSGATPYEDWQITGSPRRDQIALVHRQVFFDSSRRETGAHAEVEILNADTLRTIAKYRTQHLASWSLAEHFLIATNPETDQLGQFGILDFNGDWKKVTPSAQDTNLTRCPYRMKVVSDDVLVIYGCDGFLLISVSGKELFSQTGGTNTHFPSVMNAGDYLAVESLDLATPEALPAPSNGIPGVFLPAPERQWRIHVYDLKRLNEFQQNSKVEIMSVTSRNPYYDVSIMGALAVIEGDKLKLYRAQ